MLRPSWTTLHPASHHHHYWCGIAICHRPALKAAQTRSTIVTASSARHASSRRTWRTVVVTSAAGAPHVNLMPDGGRPDAEHVSFKDATGNDLIGILTLPGAATAAVLCHGYTSSKDGMHLAALSERLAADGMASLRFDFAGNGESGGAFKFANYSEEVDQMEAAVSYLQSRGKRVTGLLGHSKGGTEVLLYAARHDADGSGIRIVNVCGRCHLKQGIARRFDAETLARLEAEGSLQLPHPKTGQPFTLTSQEMQERMTTDMVEEAKKIRNTEVLTIHGSADDTIPLTDAEEFDRRISHHTLKIVDGADHRFSQHKDAFISLASEFLLGR